MHALALRARRAGEALTGPEHRREFFGSPGVLVSIDDRPFVLEDFVRFGMTGKNDARQAQLRRPPQIVPLSAKKCHFS
jgi:hypothetical protein